MKTRIIWVWISISVFMVVFVFGIKIAIDYNEWKEYSDSDSVRKLERFIKSDESNWFVDQARIKINTIQGKEDSLYQLACQKKTVLDCENYLNKYRGKENRYSSKVLMKLDSLSFNEANVKGTRESFQKYLDRFPNGIFFQRILDLKLTTIDEQDKQQVMQVVNQFHDAYLNRNAQGIVALCEPVLEKFESYTKIQKAQLYSMLNRKFETIVFKDWRLPDVKQFKFAQLPSGNFEVKYNSDKLYFKLPSADSFDDRIEMFSNSEVTLEISKTNYLIISYTETINSTSQKSL
jgi:hypothetical protein